MHQKPTAAITCEGGNGKEKCGEAKPHGLEKLSQNSGGLDTDCRKGRKTSILKKSGNHRGADDGKSGKKSSIGSSWQRGGQRVKKTLARRSSKSPGGGRGGGLRGG